MPTRRGDGNVRFGAEVDKKSFQAVENALRSISVRAKELDLEYKRGNKTADQVVRGVRQLDTEVKRLNATKAQTINIERQLWHTQNRAAVGFKSMATEMRSANLAAINLGRVLQDMPFGLIGISNNIEPMLQSFRRLRQEAGSTTGALVSLLRGPQLLTLGFSALGAAMVGIPMLLRAIGAGADQAKPKLEGMTPSLIALMREGRGFDMGGEAMFLQGDLGRARKQFESALIESGFTKGGEFQRVTSTGAVSPRQTRFQAEQQKAAARAPVADRAGFEMAMARGFLPNEGLRGFYDALLRAEAALVAFGSTLGKFGSLETPLAPHVSRGIRPDFLPFDLSPIEEETRGARFYRGQDWMRRRRQQDSFFGPTGQYDMFRGFSFSHEMDRETGVAGELKEIKSSASDLKTDLVPIWAGIGASIVSHIGGAFRQIFGEARSLAADLFSIILTGGIAYGLSFIPGVGPFLAGAFAGGSIISGLRAGGTSVGTVTRGTRRGGDRGRAVPVVVQVDGKIMGTDLVLAQARGSTYRNKYRI